MSSMQVDNRERGFAYAYDAPLDMRMDPDQELTAAEIVNTWDRRRIARTLREYGEERFADRIAGEIVRRRGRAELTTTFELNEAITAAIPAPARFAGGHPAKRTFQAIRIAVNGELTQLDEALPLAWGVAEDRRPRRRAHLPLARGPARQALPRREGARLHLPARPARSACAATRPRRSSCTAARSCPRRARSRRTPVRSRLACGPPASSGRSADMPEHATVTRHAAPHRSTRAGSPARRAGRSPRRPAIRAAAAPAPSSASAGSPTTASSTACCAVARASG